MNLIPSICLLVIIQCSKKNLYLNGDNVKEPNLSEVNDTEEAKDAIASASHKPQIAIIVTNLGLNAISTELALSLPKEVALGFLPYTTTLKSFVSKAHLEGHEIFMYLPFETKRYPNDDPGRLPLLISETEKENIHRMHQLLHTFSEYIGVYGAPNEIFTAYPDAIDGILSEIAKYKLKLLIGRTSDHRIVGGENSQLVIPTDVIIDAEPNIVSIKKQLDKLVTLAKNGKAAVGYANSYPVTIYTLKAWIATLEASGVEIVPVSRVITKGREENANIKQ
jgi:polysaccharide deacetylase 2 family uncharacterized protein YibQ